MGEELGVSETLSTFLVALAWERRHGHPSARTRPGTLGQPQMLAVEHSFWGPNSQDLSSVLRGEKTKLPHGPRSQC